MSSRVFAASNFSRVVYRKLYKGFTRPSLTSGKTFLEEIEEVLQERTPKYQAAADFLVKTDSGSADQIADQVLAKFRESQG